MFNIPDLSQQDFNGPLKSLAGEVTLRELRVESQKISARVEKENARFAVIGLPERKGSMTENLASLCSTLAKVRKKNIDMQSFLDLEAYIELRKYIGGFDAVARRATKNFSPDIKGELQVVIPQSSIGAEMLMKSLHIADVVNGVGPGTLVERASSIMYTDSLAVVKVPPGERAASLYSDTNIVLKTRFSDVWLVLSYTEENGVITGYKPYLVWDRDIGVGEVQVEAGKKGE